MIRFQEPERAVRTRTLSGLLLATALAWMLAQSISAQAQPSRLLVFNNTGTVAELSASVNGAWRFRGSVKPGASMPVYDVQNGDRFRAVWRGGESLHVVRLRYDRSYGGPQDTWTLGN
jgi:hypothetical protein